MKASMLPATTFLIFAVQVGWAQVVERPLPSLNDGATHKRRAINVVLTVTSFRTVDFKEADVTPRGEVVMYIDGVQMDVRNLAKACQYTLEDGQSVQPTIELIAKFQGMRPLFIPLSGGDRVDGSFTIGSCRLSCTNRNGRLETTCLPIKGVALFEETGRKVPSVIADHGLIFTDGIDKFEMTLKFVDTVKEAAEIEVWRQRPHPTGRLDPNFGLGKLIRDRTADPANAEQMKRRRALQPRSPLPRELRN